MDSASQAVEEFASQRRSNDLASWKFVGTVLVYAPGRWWSKQIRSCVLSGYNHEPGRPRASPELGHSGAPCAGVGSRFLRCFPPLNPTLIQRRCEQRLLFCSVHSDFTMHTISLHIPLHISRAFTGSCAALAHHRSRRRSVLKLPCHVFTEGATTCGVHGVCEAPGLDFGNFCTWFCPGGRALAPLRSLRLHTAACIHRFLLRLDAAGIVVVCKECVVIVACKYTLLPLLPAPAWPYLFC